jgi:outer membrane protein assembly factor BamB
MLIAGLTASGARADDWGMVGLDLARNRRSAERSGTTYTDRTWSMTVPSWTVASPVVADGFLVTVNLDGMVSAVRADTGELIWRVALQSQVYGTPTIARGRVFVPTVSNFLYALRLVDGVTLWKRDVGGMIMSSPTPIDDDIVVAPGLPKLTVVRLSAATGEIVWETPAVMWQFSNTPAAVGSGLVVVGSQQGRYYAFDAATGAFRWEYIGDGVVHLAAPIILGGRVYMAGGGTSNSVHAVDLATGQAVAGWPITLPTPAPDIAGIRRGGSRAVSSFAAAGGLLILQTRMDEGFGARAEGPYNWLSREFIVALNPSSGTVVWQRAFARAERADVNDVPKYTICPTPAAYSSDDGSPLMAVASSLDPALAILDVASGTERARYAVAGFALASPVLANGRLYTTSLMGTTEEHDSTVNHAPAAPVPAEYAAPIDGGNVTLSWSAAIDRDGDTSSYELRIDSDGEILSTWRDQKLVDAGMTSTRVTAPLIAGVTYTFAVRARDSHGALSPWSAPGTFTVTTTTDPGTTGGMSPPGGSTMPPGGMEPPTGMGGNTGSTTTGTPRIAINEPTTIQPPGATPDQSSDHTATTGCVVGGRTQHGWATVLVFVVVIAIRNRRRKGPL